MSIGQLYFLVEVLGIDFDASFVELQLYVVLFHARQFDIDLEDLVFFKYVHKWFAYLF